MTITNETAIEAASGAIVAVGAVPGPGTSPVVREVRGDLPRDPPMTLVSPRRALDQRGPVSPRKRTLGYRLAAALNRGCWVAPGSARTATSIALAHRLAGEPRPAAAWRSRAARACRLSCPPGDPTEIRFAWTFETPLRSWDLGGDLSAEDFLTGLLRGEWETDDGSLERALTASLAARWAALGMDPWDAVTKACDQLQHGTRVRLRLEAVDGDARLTIEFEPS